MAGLLVLCEVCKSGFEGKLRACFNIVCVQCMSNAAFASKDLIICPLCRKKVLSTGKCLHLLGCTAGFLSGGDEPESGRGILCEECGGETPACSWCTHCGLNLCDEHGQCHVISRTGLGHSLASLAEKQAAAVALANGDRVLNCPRHTSSPLSKYCEVCCREVCEHCVSQHSDHKSDVIDRHQAVEKRQQGIVDKKRVFEQYGGAGAVAERLAWLSSRKQSHAQNKAKQLEKVSQMITYLEGKVEQLKALPQQIEEISAVVLERLSAEEAELAGWDSEARKFDSIVQQVCRSEHIDLEVLCWQEKHYELMIEKARRLSDSSEENNSSDFHAVDEALAWAEWATGDLLGQRQATSLPLLQQQQQQQQYRHPATCQQQQQQQQYGASSNATALDCDSSTSSRANSPLMLYEADLATPTAASFSTIDCHADIVLSSDDRTACRASSGGGWRSVRGKTMYNSGKVTFRLRIDNISEPYLMLCVSNSQSVMLDDYPDRKELFGWYAHGGSRYTGRGNFGVKWLAGDIVQLALDCEEHTLVGLHERSGKMEMIEGVTGDLGLFISMNCCNQKVTIL